MHREPWRDLLFVPERAEEEEEQNKVGWQQNASRTLETKFLNEHFWPGMTDAEKNLLRSQRGRVCFGSRTQFVSSHFLLHGALLTRLPRFCVSEDSFCVLSQPGTCPAEDGPPPMFPQGGCRF